MKNNPPLLAEGVSSHLLFNLFGIIQTKNQIDMPDINFIIAQKEDLKLLIYQWLDEHPKIQWLLPHAIPYQLSGSHSKLSK